MALLLLFPALDQAKVSDQQSSNAEVTQDDVPTIEQAQKLEREKAFDKAFEAYKKLFEKNPIHYRDLMRISRILNQQSELGPILQSAYDRFLRQVEQNRQGSMEEWVKAWNELVIISRLGGESKKIEKALLDELKTFKSQVGQEVFLKKQLASVYANLAVKMGRSAAGEAKGQQLKHLARAFELDDQSRIAKQWLTILGFDEEIGDQARAVYDPSKDENTPWLVDSELAYRVLGTNNFERAVELYETARKKAPQNPQILNNLAYSYLKLAKPSPEKSLQLVDQALAALKRMQLNKQQQNQIYGSFLDTRAEALRQLGRMEDSAETYEMALQYRPKNRELLENLVKLYSDLDEKKAELFRRKLESLGD